ncbi:hypothetical protein FA13DRAFT_44528 [Coprinellus micaceus]|uniref:Uncharacterized protein n=1 Tax=Coprinellus micaceus TaxID=71717 RepID=A0A4Y7U0N1_COPMI|nr:hypothetical protein FA13DRAFT_44528 [Coprinellus micaceus]
MAKLRSGNGLAQDQSRSRNSSQSDRWSEAATSVYYSLYNSSSSVIGQGHGHSTTSLGNTFGTRTPARSLSTSRRIRPDDIFFSHLETPPPLPPLNHPAFQYPSQRGLSISQSNEGGVPPAAIQYDYEKQLRYSRSKSLPSIRNDTSSAKPRRAGSKSSLATKLADDPSKTMKKGHTRAQSKSSISSNLSRRSSAEFSAKQASLVGTDDELNLPDNWEVRVSKEFVRLSLGQDGRDEGKTSEEVAMRSRKLTVVLFY